MLGVVGDKSRNTAKCPSRPSTCRVEVPNHCQMLGVVGDIARNTAKCSGSLPKACSILEIHVASCIPIFVIFFPKIGLDYPINFNQDFFNQLDEAVILSNRVHKSVDGRRHLSNHCQMHESA